MTLLHDPRVPALVIVFVLLTACGEAAAPDHVGSAGQPPADVEAVAAEPADAAGESRAPGRSRPSVR